VHPQYTTRARSPEDLAAADAALRFLRDSNTVIGPVTNLTSALQFATPGPGLQRARRKRKRGDPEDVTSPGSHESDEDSASEEGRLKSPLAAGEKSVFRQTGREDFWALVGWAFNCSVKHKKRWARWKLLLEVMIGILDRDLDAKFQAFDEAVNGGADADTEREKFAESVLIVRYLRPHGANGSGRKHVVKAILANGDESSMRLFPEIWKNETKERKVKSEDELVKLQDDKKLDLENDQWGDYGVGGDEDDVDDGDVEMEDAKVKEEDVRAKVKVEQDIEPDFGGAEAMRLRHRLFILVGRAVINIFPLSTNQAADASIQLINITALAPKYFCDVEELYDHFDPEMRSMPLPTFRDFLARLAPQDPQYTVDYHIAFLVDLLLPPLTHKPRIWTVDQETFIKYIAPHHANSSSYTDNARMSLLMEHLLFYMWEADRLTPGGDLTNAVEKGIQARASRAIGDGRRKEKGQSREEQSAKVTLEMSGERMLMLVAMIAGDAVDGSGMDGAGESLSSSSQLSELTLTPTPEAEDEESEDAATPS
jgi:hypothetical protein